MKKHNFIYLIIAGIFFIALIQLPGTSTAFGLSPIGPPRSLLQKGQGAFALELGYSEMNLKTFGDITEVQVSPSPGPTITTPSYTEYKIENLKSTMLSVRFDTNIFENWDMFLRLGASDAADEITEIQADGSLGHQYQDFDGSFGSSWGLGTRTTFYQEGNTAWGGSFQVNWMNPGQSNITDASDTNFSGKAEIDYWEVQLAIGPTIQYDNVRIYGGPFLHFINGDLNLSGSTISPPLLSDTFDVSHEIREESQLGGFLGAQLNLGNNNTLVTEGQFTADVWSVGISTTWKF